MVTRGSLLFKITSNLIIMVHSMPCHKIMPKLLKMLQKQAKNVGSGKEIVRPSDKCILTTFLLIFWHHSSHPSRHPVWPDWAIYWTLGNFLKTLATFNLPKSFTFLGNFCKGVKSFIFLVKILLGNFYRHLAIFFWSPFTPSNSTQVKLFRIF